MEKKGNRNLFLFLCRGSSRWPRSFCFGKRTQNHSRPAVALWVPCAVCHLRRLRNSLRSNSARRNSGAGCSARPRPQAQRPSLLKECDFNLLAQTVKACGGLVNCSLYGGGSYYLAVTLSGGKRYRQAQEESRS